MRYRSSVERRLRWNHWTKWSLIVLGGFLLSMLLDPLVQSWLPDHADVEAYRRIEGKGWMEVLRSLGHLLTWALVALLVLAHDARFSGPARFDRAARVFGSALAGGAAAEILKLILRRERPGGEELYTFKPLAELLSSSNVGLPSSHTAVAMAGAAAVAAMFPWSAWVVVIAALGCGLTRILAGAHHVSDVYLGVVVGVVCARWVWGLGRPRSSIGLLP